jgi:hypothetical protein
MIMGTPTWTARCLVNLLPEDVSQHSRHNDP